jgi:hypothetical protein
VPQLAPVVGDEQPSYWPPELAKIGEALAGTMVRAAQCLGRKRFSNSQHGSAASPPIIPATKLGSGKLKTEFHNSPAIQLAASIAAMVSSRRCQIGNVGCIASFTPLVHRAFALFGDRRSRGFFQRTPAPNDPPSARSSTPAVATAAIIRSHTARCT